MKNANLFIKLSCLIPALLILCMINLKAQNELIGYTYVWDYAGHTYYLSNCKATWEEANEAANEMGGYLATFNTSGELEQLAYLIQYSIYIPNTYIWIGLRGENGIYEWANGEPVSTFLWCCNEQPVHPDGAGAIRQVYEYYASWVTHPVSYETEYLVEFPYQPNCNSANKSYVCHNGNTICVNNSAVQAHIDHGDLEGPCGPCNTNAMQSLPDDTDEMESHALLSPEMLLAQETVSEIAEEDGHHDQFYIYPNPASSTINVEMPQTDQQVMITMFSITGKMLFEESYNDTHQISIDVTSYSPGIYLVEILSGEIRSKHRVVIQ